MPMLTTNRCPHPAPPPQALAVQGTAAAALECYVPPAMLQHWRNAGSPAAMPPLLVPVPPWIAMKQPLVQHATRAKGAAATSDALEAAARGVDGAADDARHASDSAVPGSQANTGSATPGGCPATTACANDETKQGEGGPSAPSTPSKGPQEATVLLMACGYAWCALGGHFPLAGTYFQHNEVFLDTSSVLHHIRVRHDLAAVCFGSDGVG